MSLGCWALRWMGLGYGEDGTLWGGEFLLADYRHCQRLAHLKPMAMIGGEQAIRQPWRNTYVHLLNAYRTGKLYPRLFQTCH
jgi:hydrogenase maturation protein HypF